MGNTFKTAFLLTGLTLLLMAIGSYFGGQRGMLTALMIAASLAQIGEFSFILAELGVASNLLPERGRDLIVAGAILSIMLNPLAFAAADRVRHWFERRVGREGERRRAGNSAHVAPGRLFDLGGLWPCRQPDRRVTDGGGIVLPPSREDVFVVNPR
jgi:hypothetical protein